jgi:drug/metabolite transporter (DMT)-like permease
VIGEAAALGAAFCWALGSHLFGKVGRGGQVGPGALNLAKCVAGAGFFAITGLVLTGSVFPSLPGATIALLCLSGVIGLTIGDSAYFGAMATIGVRRALLLLSTAPVFTAIGGAIWLDEPLGLRDTAAILVAVAGVALVVHEQAPQAKAGGGVPVRTTVIGVLMGLGAGIGQAAGALTARSAMDHGHVSALDAALVRLPAGVVSMVIVAAVSGRVRLWAVELARPRLLAAIAGTAFVGTYVGLWLSQIALGQASSAAVAATLIGTSPLFALPLGRLLSAERITLRAATGSALACAGLAGLMLGRA